jgi:hypothetical protein
MNSSGCNDLIEDRTSVAFMHDISSIPVRRRIQLDASSHAIGAIGQVTVLTEV